MEEIDVGYNESDDINTLLKKYADTQKIASALSKEQDKLKDKIKIFLKEKGWNKYKDDESDISVSITTEKRETFDKAQLQLILNATQYAQVTKITTFEKLLVVTPESRERMKKFAKTHTNIRNSVNMGV